MRSSFLSSQGNFLFGFFCRETEEKGGRKCNAQAGGRKNVHSCHSGAIFSSAFSAAKAAGKDERKLNPTKRESVLREGTKPRSPKDENTPKACFHKSHLFDTAETKWDSGLNFLSPSRSLRSRFGRKESFPGMTRVLLSYKTLSMGVTFDESCNNLITQKRNCSLTRSRAAFTLAEMSMVLVIVGLVIVIVYPALTAFRLSVQASATQSNLQALMRSAAAFVQTNGCLPCPTPASTTGAGFGRVRGDSATASCGTCPTPEGIAPFASLGLSMQTAKDGWGRWITMRVDPALTINFGVVPPTALCLASDPSPCVTGEARKGLCQASLTATNRISIAVPGGGSQQAALLFLSHGVNGHGAFRADPLSPPAANTHPTFTGALTPCSATGGFERCNANGDLSFVNAPYTNDQAAPFDDTMAFASRDALVTLLGNPACQTTW